jgi:hypothetical protein
MPTEVVIAMVGLPIMFAAAAGVLNFLHIKRQANGLSAAITATPNFAPSKLSIGFDRASALAIDETREKLCLIRRLPASGKTISYADVLGVEVIEDGSSITRAVRPPRTANAGVGAVPTGRVATRGSGLTGRTATAGSAKVRRIDLRLLVNDAAAPLHEVNFYSGFAADANDDLVHHGRLAAHNWYALLADLMRRGAAADRSTPVGLSEATRSIGDDDELEELAQLQGFAVARQAELSSQQANRPSM